MNPFENPDPALFIVELPAESTQPTHFLVLNKFPIIPSHFILATKINKVQTAALEPEDLEAAYACLNAWKADQPGRCLYGFFNSGEHSGASQAHRHLQFVPVEGMKEGDREGKWDVLVDNIVEKNAELPFEVFWERIDGETSKKALFEGYQRLYQLALKAVEQYAQHNPGKLELHDTEDGSSSFSYNLGLTTKAMVLMPRRSEGSVLRNSEGKEIGFAALNGTVLAGTMMVKRQEEWDLLRGNNALLDEVLQNIGIPRAGSE
jgi:ATP adenylyltransferase